MIKTTMLNNLLFPKNKVMFSTGLCSFLCCFHMFSGELEPPEALFSSFIYQYHKTQHCAQNSSLFKTPLVKGKA